MAPRLRKLISERAAATTFVSDARSRRAVDHRALAAAVDTWAGELAARRVGPGARVLLDIADPLAFAVAHLAVVAAGRCSAPVDPGAPPAEAERAREVVSPAVVLTDRADRAGVRVTPHGLPATPAGVPSRADEGPGTVLLLTSGSTGAPKAVALTEAQCLHVARAVAAHHRLTRADRGFCPLPLFHVNAQVVGLLATLVAGGELVLDRRFRRTGFWELLCERDITWVNAAPAILAILARDAAEPVVPARLRFVRSASAAAATGRARPVRGTHRAPGRRELRHDRGGEPDHRDRAGRAASGRGRSAGRSASSCGWWTTPGGCARRASSGGCGSGGPG